MSTEPLVVPQTLEPGAFDRQVVCVRHRLHETPLFDDAGLAKIIDQHPRHALSICGMDDREHTGWTEGRLENLDGQAILEALQRGRFWLNVREIYTHQEVFREMVDQLYRELLALDPDLRTLWRNATLLISSPTAFVNFHLDVPCNLLWHIRGVKRVWIYPRDHPESVTPHDLAATVAQEQTEMLRYTPSMDALADCRDMHPGDMFSWPQNSPHRVDNLSEINVSLSTEHLTPAARRRIRVLQANHFLNTRLGIPAHSDATHGAVAAMKRLTAAGWLAARKLTGRRARGKAGYPVTFRVDPNAPHARVELT